VAESVNEPIALDSAPVFEAPVATQTAVDVAPVAEPVDNADHVGHVADGLPKAPPAAVEAPPSAALTPSTPTQAAPASIDVDAMLRAAGLQMTETNPERLRMVQAEQSATTPAPRAPRERKPLPTVANEPLQQIETRN
jgi:ribonuclease E